MTGWYWGWCLLGLLLSLGVHCSACFLGLRGGKGQYGLWPRTMLFDGWWVVAGEREGWERKGGNLGREWEGVAPRLERKAKRWGWGSDCFPLWRGLQSPVTLGVAAMRGWKNALTAWEGVMKVMSWWCLVSFDEEISPGGWEKEGVKDWEGEEGVKRRVGELSGWGHPD